MLHDDMVALLKTNGNYLNCLRHGHFVNDCKSLHHCKRPHHTLLHVEVKPESTSKPMESDSTALHAFEPCLSHGEVQSFTHDLSSID